MGAGSRQPEDWISPQRASTPAVRWSRNRASSWSTTRGERWMRVPTMIQAAPLSRKNWAWSELRMPPPTWMQTLVLPRWNWCMMPAIRSRLWPRPAAASTSTRASRWKPWSSRTSSRSQGFLGARPAPHMETANPFWRCRVGSSFKAYTFPSGDPAILPHTAIIGQRRFPGAHRLCSSVRAASVWARFRVPAVAVAARSPRVTRTVKLGAWSGPARSTSS